MYHILKILQSFCLAIDTMYSKFMSIFQEMLDLLKSLNHANEMASKLKKRSEDIIDKLDNEIKEFQNQPKCST